MNHEKPHKSILEAKGSAAGSLDSILTKAKWLQRLNSILQNYLDPGLMDNCCASGLHGKTLHLTVSNGTIAAYLRLQSEALTTKLRAHNELRRVESIKISIDPALGAIRTQFKKKKS